MTPRTRSFFRIFDWRFILTPVGSTVWFYVDSDGFKYVYRDILVFGVRVVRWGIPS